MEGQIRINVVPSHALVRSCRAVSAGTVSAAAMAFGLAHGEALTVAMDAFYRYAEAYSGRYGPANGEDGYTLSEDCVLGSAWLSGIQGVRALLNGDGSAAMLHDRGTDSKDNGALEDLFWRALAVAGYKESDL